MANRFEGKVAVVTGGGRGIGRAVALQFAAEGASVVVCDLGGEVKGGGADAGVAQAVVDEIVALGGAAVANGADLAAMDGAASAVSAAIDNFGRLDVLFNGAAILGYGKVHELSEEVWDEVIRVNLKSAFAMVHHAAPHMIEQRSGAIINVTSPSALGHFGMTAYGSSKQGLVGFTGAIAQELGEFGIRCNTILPCADTRMGDVSEIQTDMAHVVANLGRSPMSNQWLPGMNGQEPTSRCEDVAAVVAWLCSPETAAINDRVFYIAGGQLAVFAQPELIRARFNAEGWDLDSLLDPQVTAQFTYGQQNLMMPGK
ncbi:MAG: SDR family NAD(P)-dependent oxidoreductase [Novosphingobium sp.]|nr:SDR family NAD(P)-dependent oxidoreductase [Novosphingobium sp.]